MVQFVPTRLAQIHPMTRLFIPAFPSRFIRLTPYLRHTYVILAFFSGDKIAVMTYSEVKQFYADELMVFYEKNAVLQKS